MPIKVTKDPYPEPPLESCVVCGKPTAYWWGDGCTPCCQECADEIDDTTIRRITLREGLGPMPPKEG